jgi:hypothetical protein
VASDSREGVEVMAEPVVTAMHGIVKREVVEILCMVMPIGGLGS